MALFGDLEYIKKYFNIDRNRYEIVIDYLDKIFKKNSEEYNRLHDLPINSFEKVNLKDDIFALEQVYISKERKDTFFESHKKYIDIQVIIEGKEIIEVENIKRMNIKKPYQKDIDLIIYEDIEKVSKMILRNGDIAVFYPEDAHMPGLAIKSQIKIIKTVLKIEI